jgi:hypothetical protein
MTRKELLLLRSAGGLPRQAPTSVGPENRSYPLGGIEGPLTPRELFFVRDHFRAPELSLSTLLCVRPHQHRSPDYSPAA